MFWLWRPRLQGGCNGLITRWCWRTSVCSIRSVVGARGAPGFVSTLLFGVIPMAVSRNPGSYLTSSFSSSFSSSLLEGVKQNCGVIVARSHCFCEICEGKKPSRRSKTPEITFSCRRPHRLGIEYVVELLSPAAFCRPSYILQNWFYVMQTR